MRTATVAVKPAGGYVLARAGQLTEVWEWYQHKQLKLADLRVFFACLEMVERRCGADRQAYSLTEVATLTDLRRPRESIDRLQEAGLLRFSEDRIEFPEAAGRLVPVPRRMLRHLAMCGTRALIATALGHLLRCLFYRDKKCHSGGRCKASKHVSNVFGVDLRRVKAARAELLELGWLERVEVDQWELNRGGGVYRVNLAWGELPPPPAPGGRSLPPPDLHEEPSSRFKNQEPETPGVCIHDVKPEDLKDTGRLLELHDQAVEAGIVTSSEADRLKVVAAAEHALDVATSNAPGLFASIIRGGWWKFINQGDEEAARLRLKAHLYPAPIASTQFATTQSAPAVQGSGLSDDARLVREVIAIARRAGYKGDPFHLIRRQDPAWTRPRWEAAQREGPGAFPPREQPDPSHTDTRL